MRYIDAMDTFSVKNHWEGSTAAAEYSRAGTIGAPSHIDIPSSAAPSYGGDASRWNPEELVGAALSECHKLTFLALAKKARLDVRRYDDDATVELGAVGGVTKVVKITLATTIFVANLDDKAAESAVAMFHKAHKYCFVGNSLTSEVVLLPTIVDA
jgi:organic hydroperoxide reductase OsmC/OhrA